MTPKKQRRLSRNCGSGWSKIILNLPPTSRLHSSWPRNSTGTYTSISRDASLPEILKNEEELFVMFAFVRIGKENVRNEHEIKIRTTKHLSMNLWKLLQLSFSSQKACGGITIGEMVLQLQSLEYPSTRHRYRIIRNHSHETGLFVLEPLWIHITKFLHTRNENNGPQRNESNHSDQT